VLEQEQRRAIRPVEVVEDEQQRARVRRVHEEGGDAVEEPVAVLLGIAGRRRLHVREPLRHLGNELRDVGPCASQLLAQRVVAPRRDVLAQCFDEREVGNARLGLVAVTHQDLCAAQRRVDPCPLGQARLADSGLADQHDERAVAAERRIHGALEAVELEGASHEARSDGAGGRHGRPDRRGRLGRGADDLDACAHRGRARRPCLRVLLEQLQHQRLEIRAHLGVVPARRHRPGVQVLADHGHGVVAHEGRATGQHLVEHGAQRVEIRARRHASAHGLLGRHVGGRSHHRSLAGDARAVERDREAEVAEPDAAVVAEPDIPGLEIAVDDAVVVGVLEGGAQLLADVEDPSDGQAMALGLAELPVEVSAGDVLADQVDAAVLLVDVVDGHDVGVVAEAPHRLGFAPHAHEVETLGLDEGDRHLAIEPRVASEKDALLGALPQEARELVAALCERLGRLGGDARSKKRRHPRFASSRGRHRQRSAARVAEALAARVVAAAAGAAQRRRERVSALAAELRRLSIRMAASRTVHRVSAPRGSHPSTTRAAGLHTRAAAAAAGVRRRRVVGRWRLPA